MGQYTSAISQPTGRTFISYLYRDADGFLYNSTTGTFQGVNLAELVGANRTPYQILYVEAPVNTYRWDLVVTAFLAGDYSYTSRELSNGVEYTNIHTEAFTVAAGAVNTTDIVFKFDTAAQRSLFVYIKNKTTSEYLDTNGVLSDFDIASAVEAIRTTFRHSYVEDPAGTYTFSLDPTNLPDGAYEFYTNELSGEIEISAGESSSVNIKDGKHLLGLLLDTISLSDSTQGVDNFRYVTSGGSGVEGAVVSIYIASEYNLGVYTNVLGTTTTNSKGRWVDPVRLPIGETYTIKFEKLGRYGPNTVEVTL